MIKPRRNESGREIVLEDTEYGGHGLIIGVFTPKQWKELVVEGNRIVSKIEAEQKEKENES